MDLVSYAQDTLPQRQPHPVTSIRDASIIRDSVNRYADQQKLTDDTQRTKARLYAIALRKKGYALHSCITGAQEVIDEAVRIASRPVPPTPGAAA